MNGVMFGGEGPMMKGTWYNPNTGDVFTVRDSFFEDNNYVVTTTDGRYLNYNQIQHYIQSDQPETQLKAMFQNNKSEKKEDLPDSVKSILAGEDDDMSNFIIPDDDIYGGALNKPLGNLNNTPNTVYHPVATPVNVNNTIIEKALKNTNGAKLTIIVDWPDYPVKEIAMLTDIMEIPVDEIVKWYCDKLDTSWILDDIKTAIYKKLMPTPEIPVQIPEVVNDNLPETETIKPTNKSKTQKSNKKTKTS